jgi:hypothetical protein
MGSESESEEVDSRKRLFTGADGNVGTVGGVTILSASTTNSTTGSSGIVGSAAT